MSRPFSLYRVMDSASRTQLASHTAHMVRSCCTRWFAQRPPQDADCKHRQRCRSSVVRYFCAIAHSSLVQLPVLSLNPASTLDIASCLGYYTKVSANSKSAGHVIGRDARERGLITSRKFTNSMLLAWASGITRRVDGWEDSLDGRGKIRDYRKNRKIRN